MSPETIFLADQRVDYQLKRSHRRTIGFSVSEKGLAVTAPHFVSKREVEAALCRKSDWILKKLAPGGPLTLATQQRMLLKAFP